MSNNRPTLPQLADRLFLTDGGMETTFIFHQGLDLPHFAAFDLLKTAEGYQAIANYFRTYLDLAVEQQVGFVLESPTWRANPDWGSRLGYSSEELATANREAIALLHRLRQAYETPDTPIVVSGCIGPRGNGYSVNTAMTVTETEAYHRPQIEAFAEAGADLAAAFTMNYVQEAIGIVRAAQAVGLPVVISFTVETDGHLPSGQSLREAISQVDAATDNGPAYYMINCAHPSHFATMLTPGEPWVQRIRALRANASTMSHTELDAAETLDDGNPADLGQQYRNLRDQFPQITILGGCCGTDLRHVKAIANACLPIVWAHLNQNPLAAIGV